MSWKDWIRSLAASEKDEWLLRIAQGDEPYARRSLLRCFREAAPDRNALPGDDGHTPGRTVAEISAAFGGSVSKPSTAASPKRPRKNASAGQRRKPRLGRSTWKNIASRAPWRSGKRSLRGLPSERRRDTTSAVNLLIDLKDAAALADCREAFDRRLDELSRCHAGKPTFISRLRNAGLAG